MSFFITVLASILIFGGVIFIHELGHFLTAKYSKIKVNEFALGMGPTVFKIQKGETTYAIRLLPIGGFVSMEGEDEESDDDRGFQKAPVGNRILVVVAGAVMNFVLGIILLVIITSMGQLIPTCQVGGFNYENSNAYNSGLREGDIITAVNGYNCLVMDDLNYELIRAESGTADFTVKRDGEVFNIGNVEFITYDEETDTNQLDFFVKGKEKTPLAVIQQALGKTVSISKMIFVSVIDLFTGRVPINDLSGPVGIVSVISSASAYGIKALLEVASIITINLGIFNIMPLPALDGGKLALLIVEAIRGKAIPQKFEIVINSLGLMLLLGLMAFVTLNDITRLVL